MTKHAIQVNESVVNNNLRIEATAPKSKTINIVSLFKPYYKRGFKLKTLDYTVGKPTLQATLTIF